MRTLIIIYMNSPRNLYHTMIQSIDFLSQSISFLIILNVILLELSNYINKKYIRACIEF